MSYDSYAEWALKGDAPAEVCSHLSSVSSEPGTCLDSELAPACGNGVMEPGEECESGSGENETSTCCVGCLLAVSRFLRYEFFSLFNYPLLPPHLLPLFVWYLRIRF